MKKKNKNNINNIIKLIKKIKIRNKKPLKIMKNRKIQILKNIQFNRYLVYIHKIKVSKLFIILIYNFKMIN